MIQIAVADDHPIILDGLLRWLKDVEDIEVVCARSSLTELEHEIPALAPDLLVLDFRMPGMNGVQSVANLAERGWSVVIFSFLQEDEIIGALERAGARAFVSKHEPVAKLVEVIRCVASGQTVFPDHDTTPQPHEQLSKRERLVFNCIIEGKTPKEIAFECDLASSSVYTYAERVRRKLGVESTQGIVQYAYSVGLIDPREHA